MAVQSQDVMEAFNYRFATKTFDPARKITDENWNTILEAARLSPSSFGLEPWDIIVVQTETLRQELKEVTWGAQGTLPTASHFIILTAKTGQALDPSGEHITHMMTDVKNMNPEAQQGMASKFTNFVVNDFQLNDPEMRHQWAARQAYIALGNMMTAAALLGIDSQPVEGFTIEKVTDLLAEHGLIDPQQNRPVVMASFGYRGMEATPKTRRPLEEIVTWA